MILQIKLSFILWFVFNCLLFLNKSIISLKDLKVFIISKSKKKKKDNKKENFQLIQIIIIIIISKRKRVWLKLMTSLCKQGRPYVPPGHVLTLPLLKRFPLGVLYMSRGRFLVKSSILCLAIEKNSNEYYQSFRL